MLQKVQNNSDESFEGHGTAGEALEDYESDWEFLQGVEVAQESFVRDSGTADEAHIRS